MSPRTLRLLALATLLPLSLGIYAAHQLNQEQGTAPPLDVDVIGTRPRDAVDGDRTLLGTALERLDTRLENYPDDYEASLLKAIILFKIGRHGDALDGLDRLLTRVPTFHLAHLVRGDLLLAQARPVSDIGSSPLLARLDRNESGLALLKEEAEARLAAYLDTIPQGRIPASLTRLPAVMGTAVVVDKSAHRLYVYRRDGTGVPRLVQDFYVSTGKLGGNKLLKGDLKTPEGVYFVTSHIPDARLPSKYGIGAFPLNYPNDWDRRLGKTGYGIWLHGTDEGFYARPPLDSEGCVVLPNIDLRAAGAYIEPGRTPVIIAESVAWLDEADWHRYQRELMAALEQWRRDWESLDVEAYLGHYADGFWSEGYDLERWRARKQRVAVGKTEQVVSLDDVALFLYPRTAAEGRDLAVAEFRQRYRSNNFSSDMQKRLYLVREEGTWKVLYEGARD